MSAYQVTRCICHSRTFEEIKAFAEDHNLTTVEQLRGVQYCSCNCRLCEPYIKKMLKTGKTAFKVNSSIS